MVRLDGTLLRWGCLAAVIVGVVLFLGGGALLFDGVSAWTVTFAVVLSLAGWGAYATVAAVLRFLRS